MEEAHRPCGYGSILFNRHGLRLHCVDLHRFLFAGSIPYVGPVLLTILYPLGFLLGLLTVFITIAVCLSTFLFPSIVSVRRAWLV